MLKYYHNDMCQFHLGKCKKKKKKFLLCPLFLLYFPVGQGGIS